MPAERELLLLRDERTELSLVAPSASEYLLCDERERRLLESAGSGVSLSAWYDRERRGGGVSTTSIVRTVAPFAPVDAMLGHNT